MALALLLGSAWAKASRYNLNAVPSPQFSSSVKIARSLFHCVPDDDCQALIQAATRLPEPDWSSIAPAPPLPELPCNRSLPFQALRAPPSLV